MPDERKVLEQCSPVLCWLTLIIDVKIVTGNATYLLGWSPRRNCVFYQSCRNVLAAVEEEEEEEEKEEEKELGR